MHTLSPISRFSGSDDEVKKSLNQLEKAFDKRFVAPHEAKVAMIAVFRDSYPHPPGNASIPLTCPRYTLEVKRFLYIQKMKVPKSIPRN